MYAYYILFDKIFMKLDIRSYIICDRISENCPSMHKDKYLEYTVQLFKESYLKNEWSCFHTILHHSTITKDILVHELFKEYLTKFPTILDSFSLIP